MDEEDCDPALLRNTYRQFARVNALLTGWRRLFDVLIAPRLRPGATILDVGCGAGDMAQRLWRWSRQAGVAVSVTAIDKDPRAIDFALADMTARRGRRSQEPRLEFRVATAEELAGSGERFDVVVSNHLLHHLSDAEFPDFLATTAAVSRTLVIHNDMRRHRAAYAAFYMTRPLFPRSLIVTDGLKSIRRAFTPAELRLRLPDDWELLSLAPFRNVAVLKK